jgi:hypothetical protein
MILRQLRPYLRRERKRERVRAGLTVKRAFSLRGRNVGTYSRSDPDDALDLIARSFATAGDCERFC